MTSAVIRSTATLVLALALAGCGGAPSQSPDASASTPAVTATPDASPSPEATPTAEATPAPTAEPTAEPVTEWTVETFDRPEPPAGIAAVILWGDTLVAVGQSGWNGAVWTQAPGREWERQEDVPEPIGERGEVGLNAVVEGPNGLVATGVAGTRNQGPAATVVWTSPDGVTWTETQQIEGDVLFALAAGDPGLIATGTGAGGPDPSRIAVWTSPDGSEWTQADTAALGNGVMGDATWHDGMFVGVGAVLATGESGQQLPQVGRVWTSPDGAAWTESYADEREHTAVASIALTESGLVAVAQDFSGDQSTGGLPQATLEVWTSTDAAAWEITPIQSEPGQVLGFAASPAGLVAVGFVPGDMEQRHLALWSSADAATWTFVEEVSDQPAGNLTDVIILEDRVVAVGTTEGESREDSHPIVVTGPLP